MRPDLGDVPKRPGVLINGGARRTVTGGVRRVFAALAVSLFAAVATLAAAQETAPQWDAWEREAQNARELIENGDPTGEELTEIREEAEAQRTAAKTVSERAAEEIARLQAELEALGPAPEDGAAPETPEAVAIRKDLNAKLAEAKAQQGRAQQVATRAATLIEDVTQLGQQRFISRLETRGPSPLTIDAWQAALRDLSGGISEVSSETYEAVTSPATRDTISNRAPAALLAIAVAVFILFGVRGLALGALIRSASTHSGRRWRLALGLGATAARLLTAVVAGGLLLYALVTSGILGPMGEAVLRGVARGLGYLIVAYTLAAALFSPNAATLRLSAIPNDRAGPAFRSMLLTAAAMALDFVFQAFAEATEAGASAIAVFSFITVTLVALTFFRLAHVARAVGDEGGGLSFGGQVYAILRRTAMAAAVIAPLLTMAGYEFAGRSILFPTVRSAALLAFGYLIYALIQEAVEAHLVDGKKEGERLRLIPVLVGFILLCIGAPLLALIWGASVADLSSAYEVVAAGLVIGDVAISPMDFITFAVVFGIGYTATRAAQRVLGGTVLPKTGMTEGGASALTAGVGYVGVIVAAIIAISATGIDLSNLAIVAGALSVGIGFGLQTIVSNFVSGVILLIERPVKVGDWVSVGTSQGYVRKVNVRSTEIEGFDRSSFIVPNSDLISSTVLNMTHSNKIGRVIVPIGVAYGTDPRKIEAILLELGKEHPMVISSPSPTALFMNFGADALEFELRVFLNDVNWMLSVKSDLNFAIAERFANEGIEIPYAQRDLHIRNPEALAAALRAPGGAPQDDGADAATTETGTKPGAAGPASGAKPDGEAHSLPDGDAPDAPAR